jgi:hypothetical protein
MYGSGVLSALHLVWEFFRFQCGKFLAPLIRERMSFIAAWIAFGITAEIREKLMTISPATIDRALKADRDKLLVRGISGTKLRKLLKKHILVRTHTFGTSEHRVFSGSTRFITTENDA